MYYRLIEINARPLPATGIVGGRAYAFVGGGMILEPTSVAVAPGVVTPDGYAVLRMIGARSVGGPREVLASAAGVYQMSGDATLAFMDAGAGMPTQMRGHLADSVLSMRVDGAERFLALGTTLTLAAAPDDPIPDEWADLFLSPSFLVRVSPPTAPGAAEAIARYTALRESESRDEASRRAKRAWCSPVGKTR